MQGVGVLCMKKTPKGLPLQLMFKDHTLVMGQGH